MNKKRNRGEKQQKFRQVVNTKTGQITKIRQGKRKELKKLQIFVYVTIPFLLLLYFYFNQFEFLVFVLRIYLFGFQSKSKKGFPFTFFFFSSEINGYICFLELISNLIIYMFFLINRLFCYFLFVSFFGFVSLFFFCIKKFVACSCSLAIPRKLVLLSFKGMVLSIRILLILESYRINLSLRN